jgi:hypothetical protein
VALDILGKRHCGDPTAIGIEDIPNHRGVVTLDPKVSKTVPKDIVKGRVMVG